LGERRTGRAARLELPGERDARVLSTLAQLVGLVGVVTLMLLGVLYLTDWWHRHYDASARATEVCR